jgi:serine protease Do
VSRRRFGGVVLALACGGAPGEAPAAAAQDPPPSSQTIESSRRTAIVTAAARVAPSVVSVNVVRRQRQATGDLWGFFFGQPLGERLVQGLGSGFIVSRDGVVITNQHVVEGAEQVVVTGRDGTDYPARVLGEDPLTDIAVLQIDGDDLPTAPIGASHTLVIGEWVVAIGNPFGYLLGNSEPTVTAGVVSAVGRNLLPSANQSGIYVGMIQTDAAINPGNSGGPLVNSLGEVVGVNSSILSRTGGSEGLGFAIPIERALRVAEELRRHGQVRRAWVGVEVVGSEGMREWKEKGGLGVTRVVPGSPAARAGLERGDVLVQARGQPLRTFLDWEAIKLEVGPGDTLTVDVARTGRRRAVRLRVEDLPSTRAEKVDVLGGLRLITVTPPVRQERNIQSESGALIYDLPEETQRQTGLRPGDVIRQINRTPVTRAEDVARALEAARGRGAVQVYFERAGRINLADFYVR